ncbi:amino acid aminotransferase [Cupriavidus sp. L7L]|uniref:amino acid aminotransferase n=1 Tax=Cupriavidus sp. L7L TaxID=2546443 RepID=UPI0010544628|nr:amino acid aminotransferase [Cupriavidus sp. L7L]TDF62664.1 aspartate/tyrosine/aromatic aminotransferase [Cupriavidus sp. L7L]
MFNNVEAYPGDPILSLLEGFLVDSREQKTNLSIGLYYDDQGQIPILESVQQAKTLLQANPAPHTYLPMEGVAAYRDAVQRLVFGADAPQVTDGQIATVQTVGGSGAIHLAARFIKQYLPDSAVWMSDPTWDNHRTLLESAGLAVNTYPYLNAAGNGVDFDAMLSTLQTLPLHSVVLLQPSCHNPTGCDLTPEQFDEVIAIVEHRNLVPFIDMAYQGFGEGLNEDAGPIRKMLQKGLPMFVSNSFSKNFSLYGERVGGLSVVCDSKHVADNVVGQLKAIVRKIYSSPPAFGGQVVATILSTPQLRANWENEVAAMQARMVSMRHALRSALEAQVDYPADFLTRQSGMFSYTGLSATEVDYMREAHGVYLVRSGRICIAGLNSRNVEAVASSIADVISRRRRS